jgi:transglutaminase-like putative cysteine protease
MQKRILLILALLIRSILFFAQDMLRYDTDLINDSLKLNANAVSREEQLTYTYQSKSLNTRKYRQVITVLNKNGDEDAVFQEFYDKFRKFSWFKGAIYNEDGRLIRQIKSSEVKDASGSAGYPLFGDIRYKYFNPLISVYPYTVEYEYELEIAGSYYFPDWIGFDGYNVSIVKSGFTMVVPVEYELLYKQYSFSEPPVVETIGKLRQYTWTAENVKAVDKEPMSDDPYLYFRTVFTTPSEFVLDGYNGIMHTWEDFSDWISQLNKGRDGLSLATIAKVQEMVKDLPDERAKVKRLYAYLQERTRYFNVALGIGGLQPVDANVVDEVGYGDCKGLSNYMKALLKAAGIQSYYTLVNSGGDFPQLIDDFPSHQFDHAILCVPMEKDTIWLECTSQTIPFGFLGDFTSDRKVLVIKEHGGHLAKTPVYGINDNFQYTKARVNLTSEGNATAEVSRKFGGLQYDDNSNKLIASAEDQKEWLYDYLKIPNFRISHSDFKQKNPDLPESVLNVTLEMATYCSTSGKRMFLPVNLVNRSTYVPSKTKKRWSNFERFVPYIDSDSVEFCIPEGMSVEFIPEKKEIHSPFGNYISSVTFSDNKIYYYRQVEMFKGNFKKEQYEDLMKFYRDISNADKVQAVLIKKEG